MPQAPCCGGTHRPRWRRPAEAAGAGRALSVEEGLPMIVLSAELGWMRPCGAVELTAFRQQRADKNERTCFY
jgi:hypothetical protein